MNAASPSPDGKQITGIDKKVECLVRSVKWGMFPDVAPAHQSLADLAAMARGAAPATGTLSPLGPQCSDSVLPMNLDDGSRITVESIAGGPWPPPKLTLRKTAKDGAHWRVDYVDHFLAATGKVQDRAAIAFATTCSRAPAPLIRDVDEQRAMARSVLERQNRDHVSWREIETLAGLVLAVTGPGNRDVDDALDAAGAPQVGHDGSLSTAERVRWLADQRLGAMLDADGARLLLERVRAAEREVRDVHVALESADVPGVVPHPITKDGPYGAKLMTLVERVQWLAQAVKNNQATVAELQKHLERARSDRDDKDAQRWLGWATARPVDPNASQADDRDYLCTFTFLRAAAESMAIQRTNCDKWRACAEDHRKRAEQAESSLPIGTKESGELHQRLAEAHKELDAVEAPTETYTFGKGNAKASVSERIRWLASQNKMSIACARDNHGRAEAAEQECKGKVNTLMAQECQIHNLQEDVKRLRERANRAQLGLATTEQLLDELQARARVGGYANYRTVDARRGAQPAWGIGDLLNCRDGRVGQLVDTHMRWHPATGVAMTEVKRGSTKAPPHVADIPSDPRWPNGEAMGSSDCAGIQAPRDIHPANDPRPNGPV